LQTPFAADRLREGELGPHTLLRERRRHRSGGFQRGECARGPVGLPRHSRLFAIVVDDLHVIETQIILLKEFLPSFIGALTSGDLVALVFVGRSDLSVDFTNDLVALRSAPLRSAPVCLSMRWTRAESPRRGLLCAAGWAEMRRTRGAGRRGTQTRSPRRANRPSPRRSRQAIVEYGRP
jgi:hypothetical protein